MALSETLIGGAFAREILDSRGNPTVQAEVTLSNGVVGRAAVPSGARTREREPIELRDSVGPKSQLQGNESLRKRFGGKGVRAAVNNANPIISKNIIGMNASDQIALDSALITLDGTDNTSKLGANAILSVSMAAANAVAKSLKVPLFTYLGGVNAKVLPVSMMNILDGGAHSDAPVDIQELIIMPRKAPSIREAIRTGAETFHSLKKILKDLVLSSAVGDEGGFAPNISYNEHALEMIVQAIELAGYRPENDISIAFEAAASEFYDEQSNSYVFKKIG
jgi:enolase